LFLQCGTSRCITKHTSVSNLNNLYKDVRRAAAIHDGRATAGPDSQASAGFIRADIPREHEGRARKRMLNRPQPMLCRLQAVEDPHSALTTTPATVGSISDFAHGYGVEPALCNGNTA